MSYEGDLIEHYREVRQRLSPLSTPVARRVIARPIMHLPPPPPPRPVKHGPLAWQNIVEEVADKHGVPYAHLVKPGFRPQPVCNARQEAFYRLREERLFSWAEIARLMGGFDHTTVIHGYRKHKKRMGI